MKLRRIAVICLVGLASGWLASRAMSQQATVFVLPGIPVTMPDAASTTVISTSHQFDPGPPTPITPFEWFLRHGV